VDFTGVHAASDVSYFYMRFRLATALLSVVFVSFSLWSSSCDASCFVHELHAADRISTRTTQATQALGGAAQEEPDAHCSHFANPGADTRTAFNLSANPCAHSICVQNWLPRAKFGIADHLQSASLVATLAPAIPSASFTEESFRETRGSPPASPSFPESASLNLRI